MAAALAGMTSPTGSSQYQPHLQGPQRVLGTLSSASQDIGLQSTSRDSVGSLGSAQSPGYFNAAVSVTSASMGSRGEAGFSYEPRRTSPPLSLGTARTHGETTGAEESKQLPSPLSPAADSYAAFAGKLGLLSEASSPTQQQQQQQQPQQQCQRQCQKQWQLQYQHQCQQSLSAAAVTYCHHHRRSTTATATITAITISTAVVARATAAATRWLVVTAEGVVWRAVAPACWVVLLPALLLL